MSSAPGPTRTALAALLLTTLTACGGGGSTAAPSTTTSTASSPTASSPTASSPEASSPTATPSHSGSHSSAPATASAAAATITIDDFEFEVPRKVAPGSVVRITNKDAELHTFTSQQAGLDVQVPIGKTVQFRAPSKAGTYRAVCTLHAGMDTTLVVG